MRPLWKRICFERRHLTCSGTLKPELRYAFSSLYSSLYENMFPCLGIYIYICWGMYIRIAEVHWAHKSKKISKNIISIAISKSSFPFNINRLLLREMSEYWRIAVVGGVILAQLTVINDMTIDKYFSPTHSEKELLPPGFIRNTSNKQTKPLFRIFLRMRNVLWSQLDS